MPIYTVHDIEQIYSYAEFMVISKEVSTLENDMLDLKQSLSEWKSMPSLLHIDDSASLAGAACILLVHPNIERISQTGDEHNDHLSQISAFFMLHRCKHYTHR